MLQDGEVRGRLPYPRLIGALLLTSLLAGCEELGESVSVDLAVFSPTGQVSVEDDGRVARIGESKLTTPSSLAYRSFSVPRDAKQLRFTYRLEVADGGEDYFDVFVGDLATPLISDGGAGGVYEGEIVQDLSAHRGDVVAVIFDLTSGFGDGNRRSSVTISQVSVLRTARDDG